MNDTTDIYFDFEFIDDGREIVPISLGMCVSREGRVYYPPDHELYIEYEFDPARANDWVRENVFPHLNVSPWDYAVRCSKHFAAAKISNWVKSVCGDKSPRLVGYYPSYDFVLLCQHFGTMMQTPKGWPMRPECLMQMADELGVSKDEFPKQKNEHHALADAKWNRELHKDLDDVAAARSGALGATSSYDGL